MRPFNKDAVWHIVFKFLFQKSRDLTPWGLGHGNRWKKLGGLRRYQWTSSRVLKRNCFEVSHNIISVEQYPEALYILAPKPEKGYEECRKNIDFIYISGSTFLQGAQMAAWTLGSIISGASVHTCLLGLFSPSAVVSFYYYYYFLSLTAIHNCNILVYSFT